MQDAHGRTISYLRLSVTDRCDLRCFYCLPRGHRDFATPSAWLSADELQRLVRQFAVLGVRHVRLTGGEPLVRRELPQIVERLRAIEAIDDLSLSSNATRLDSLSQALRSAGVDRLNISLDTLDADTFRRITGGDLARVLRGIDSALQAGFTPIKINTVAMRGINDHELPAMVDFCRERGLALRFIETMPVGAGGMAANPHYLPLHEVEQALRRRYRLSPAAIKGSGPARHYQVDDSALVVGFITPRSQHFCATCNRVRLSAAGDLYLCLGEENKVPLGRMLRDGAADRELRQAILSGLRHKPEHHRFDQPHEQPLRPMSALGG